MYNSDTELMFPLRIVPQLRDLRGVVWQNLVDEVSSEHAELRNQAAFTLMMARLGGCQGCNIDSFRGMRGCLACAHQTVRRYRGSDDELMQQYRQSLTDVDAFIQGRKIESLNVKEFKKGKIE